MATCTAGQPKCRTGHNATGALNAAATKYANTTPWPPRILQWQLSGIMRQMLVLLTVWWHKAIKLLVGIVKPVATSGLQTLHARVGKKKSGCPECAKSARTGKKQISHPAIAEDPVLLAQWDHKRNADCGHFPDAVTMRSSKPIFWLCNKCPAGQQHSWSARPSKRTGQSQTGCPFCAGRAACACNSLQALYPSIAAEWDHVKNKGQPSDYPANSIRLACWSSPQRGSWQQTIQSRVTNVRRKAAIAKHAQQRLSAAGPL